MIKFGIVGMGIRGKLYANTIGQNPFAEVAAFCEIDESAHQALQETYHAKAYRDYREMIDAEPLDAVIIATPDFLHKDAVIYAAEHKLSMMVEKPFSTSVEECLEMTETVERNGVVCMVAFENRWSLPFIHTKNLIAAGELGDILNIYAKLNNTTFVPTKMLPWAGKTTPAWFLFPHLVDMASWLTGKEAKSVYATGVKRRLAAAGVDTYDSIQAILTYEDGSAGVFTTTWVLPETYPVVADQKMSIVGEKSSLDIDLCEQMLRMATQNNFNNPRVLGTPVYGKLNAPPCHMLNHFIDNLKDGTKPLADQRDGLKNTMIIQAIHESVNTGKAIEIRKPEV